jgi:hypothetical protein
MVKKCIFFLYYSNIQIQTKKFIIFCIAHYFLTLRFNTLRTGDADLRVYITTVQDG